VTARIVTTRASMTASVAQVGTIELAIAALVTELRSREIAVEIARVAINNGDRHCCGRRAAQRALAALGEDPDALGYDGTRPIVRGGAAAISITHDREIAIAIAARVARLGIDRAPNDPRLPALAERFLDAERAFATTVEELAACFAAKEAALKALGVGLIDGGVLDGTAITVVSLAPPKLSHPELSLVVARDAAGALAVAYTRG
jgi:phosphopantetheinyl transferase (holo-ACP synthase)